MAQPHDFWKLEHLSNAQLLESLGSVLSTQRRTLAELVAHLGELEERRLQLEAACSSMFSYCVGRLGMSEDEACRRIDLARLARRFPALFAELESGQITLSVALVLKPILTQVNHRELFCAARGKSTQQARELVAERSPKPDAPSTIRKLPERRPAASLEPARSGLPAAPPSAPELAAAAPSPSISVPASMSPPERTSSSVRSDPSSVVTPVGVPALRPGPVPASRNRIDPLSAQRFRIQFTADADLKFKLELARDLLRHAHPTGDFAPVVARALDLLLDDLQRRRFGAGAGRKSARPSTRAHGPSQGADSSSHPEVSLSARSAPPSSAASAAAVRTSGPPSREPAPPPSAASAAAHSNTPAPSADVSAPHAATQARRPYIPRAARGAVLERDGLGCSWIDAHGVRCSSRAWLELDHRQAHGKGGSSEPDNLRWLCRAHNQLAAEHAYGRAHLERASRGARARRRQHEPGHSPTT